MLDSLKPINADGSDMEKNAHWDTMLNQLKTEQLKQLEAIDQGTQRPSLDG